MLDVSLTFIAGFLFLLGIYTLKPYVNCEGKNMAALNWLLYVLWYCITWVGISFVVMNARVGHVKATSTGIFLFFGLSIILAVVLARLVGFMGKKKENTSIAT